MLVLLLRRRWRRWWRGVHRRKCDTVEVGDEGLPATAQSSVQSLMGRGGWWLAAHTRWWATALKPLTGADRGTKTAQEHLKEPCSRALRSLQSPVWLIMCGCIRTSSNQGANPTCRDPKRHSTGDPCVSNASNTVRLLNLKWGRAALNSYISSKQLETVYLLNANMNFHIFWMATFRIDAISHFHAFQDNFSCTE